MGQGSVVSLVGEPTEWGATKAEAEPRARARIREEVCIV